MEWFVLWLIFVVLLVLLPLVYGWAYRGWGPPPYPYRRPPRTPAEVEAEAEAEARAEEDEWGVLAIAVWTVAAIALVWLLVAALV